MSRWPRNHIPRIDWSNPLTRGLVSCVTVVGGRIVDLANPARTFTVAGKSAGRGLKGRHVQGTLSGSEHLIPSPAIPTAGGNWTYHVLSRFPANAGNASMAAANPSGAYWSFGYVSGGEVVVWSGGGLSFSPSLVPPSSGWAVMSVSGNATTNHLRGMMDNGAVGTITTTIAQDMTSLLGDSSTSSRGWPDTALMLVYNRTQSDAEMRRLQRDIWQIFEPVKRVIPLVAPSTLNSYTLSAGAGSIAVTGSAAALRVSRKLPAAAGSFVISGSAAALKLSRRLAAGAGSLALVGGDVTFSIQGQLVLLADAGAIALTGGAANLRLSRKLGASSGAISLSGGAATLRKGRRIDAQAGAIALTGSAAALRVARRLQASGGALVVMGGEMVFRLNEDIDLTVRADRLIVGYARLRIIPGTARVRILGA